MVTETVAPIIGTFNAATGELIGVGQAGVVATSLSTPDASVAIVANDLGDVAFAHAVGDEGNPEQSDAPWGRGREVRMAPGLLETATIDLSQSQSMSGAGQGATTLVYTKHNTVTAETGVINVLDDRLSKRSVASRGCLSHFSIDGANNDPDAQYTYLVHGYYAPQPTIIAPGDTAPDAESHSFFETLIAGTTGDAYHIVDHKQVRMLYAKGVAVDGVGYYAKDVNDSKTFGCGFNGKKGAVKFRHLATPKMFAGDSWIPANFDGQATWDVADQVRMLVDAYEIEGRTVMIGRNFGNTNRWEMADNIWRAINYKIVEGLSPTFTFTRDDATTTGTLSCMIYLEDIDNTIFDSCTMRYDTVTPTQEALDATPDYFLQLGTKKTGALNIAKFPGNVKFQNMSGIVHSRGRFGDTAPRLAFKKHYCDRPELVEWDFRAGGLELINWNDAAPPRHYIKASPFGATTPTTALKADYPMGYLWATIATGGTLDDGNTTFNIPIAQSLAPAGQAWAYRVWP